jgi:hypothetical protein
MHNSPQLLHARDFLIIDAEDDIVFFETGLSGGRILINHGDFDAILVFHMQLA